jgi:NEMP family
VPEKNSGFQFRSPTLRIYCYRGRPKFLLHLFHTINLELKIDSDDFTQYEGDTPEVAQTAFETQRSIFSFNLLSQKKRLISLDPFNQTCIGIEASEPYTVKLSLIRIDFWKVIMLAVGVFTFFSARQLSQNSLFYYLCGILLGISASFLVVVFLISKLIPRKPMMYGVMVGGWTLGIYFAQMIYENIRMILVTYQVYAFWYVVVTGFVSFVICYRMGPPTNQRSKNLIQWSLQFLALILVFFASAYKEAVVGIGMLLFLIYYFPKRWVSSTQSVWRRRFPPKRRLLSNDEYFEQGVLETTRALEELRNYCSSPECKQWSLMRKLKDPVRFSSFVEGTSHIMDNEILDYETSQIGDELSDDDEDEPVNVLESSDEEEVVTPRRRTNGVAAVRQGSKPRQTSTPTLASRFGKNNYSQRSRNVPELSEDDD